MRFGASVENMFVNESNIGFLCLQVLEVTGFERNETGDIVDKDGKVLGKDPNPKFSATITFPDGRTETLSIDTAESVASRGKVVRAWCSQRSCFSRRCVYSSVFLLFILGIPSIPSRPDF